MRDDGRGTAEERRRMRRKDHWEAIYDAKSPLDVSWYQLEPALSVGLIEAAGIARDAPVIDVGGGASVLVDHLWSRGYTNLTVLDISARSLAYARQRMGENGRRVTWIEADVTRFLPPAKYEVWHDRAVFHFLTDPADRRAYRDALEKALLPGGHLVIASFSVGGPTRCSGLDIVQYDAARLSRELGDEFRLVGEVAELHMTPGGKEQEFTYFHFRRKVPSS